MQRSAAHDSSDKMDLVFTSQINARQAARISTIIWAVMKGQMNPQEIQTELFDI